MAAEIEHGIAMLDRMMAGNSSAVVAGKGAPVLAQLLVSAFAF